MIHRLFPVDFDLALAAELRNEQYRLRDLRGKDIDAANDHHVVRATIEAIQTAHRAGRAG
jgi:hypothetical protein